MNMKSIFSEIPERLHNEQIDRLAGSGNVTIERIVSEGQSSPEGYWYDQEENEWVLLLRGGARLRFEVSGQTIVLNPGDWIDIPAHLRHRVEWTDPKEKTVWLTVFYR